MARSRGRAPPRRGRGRAGAAPDGARGPSRPGCMARSARRMAERLAPMRLRAGARARLVGRSRRRRTTRCDSAIRRHEIVAVEPDAAWLARASRARRAALVVARPRRAQRRPMSSAEPRCRARPRRAGLGQHGAARRRRSAGAVRALARAARGRRLRDVLLPRPGHACASCASCTRALGWPAPTPGFVDMHDLGDMLVAAGFADPVMDQETLTLSWASAEALLAELRTLGGNARAGSLRRPAHAALARRLRRRARSARRRRRPDRARASRSPTATRFKAAPRAPGRRRRGLARRHARDGAATPPTPADCVR